LSWREKGKKKKKKRALRRGREEEARPESLKGGRKKNTQPREDLGEGDPERGDSSFLFRSSSRGSKDFEGRTSLSASAAKKWRECNYWTTDR